MDRFSKWPGASFCTSTDGETAINFLEQYIQLSGIPTTLRTDKATAFTGRLFRGFCKKHYFNLIYGTLYIHTPTGLVERGLRTVKENLLTNIKAGELHYGRKPITEISNPLNLDKIEQLRKRSISAKPDTLQV